MSEDRTLPYGTPLPASWLASVQEYIGTAAVNFHLTLANSTTVQVVAGAASAQVGLGIDGLFRYISATQAAAVTGAPGVYDIFAVTGPNSFSNTPAVDTDLTDYSFLLQVLAHGTTPTTSGTLTNFRKVGELDWDGTKITRFRPMVGEVTPTNPITPTAPTAAVSAIRTVGASGQTAPIQTWENSSGTVVGTITPTGGATFADAITGTSIGLAGAFSAASGSTTGAFTVGGLLTAASVSVSGSAAFTASPTVPTVSPASDASTKVADTQFVQNAIALALGALTTPTKTYNKLHSFTTNDQTSPDPTVAVMGSFGIYPASSETPYIIGVLLHCVTRGGSGNVSTFKVQYDHGSHGAMIDVPGLTGLQPNVGTMQYVPVTGGPLPLAALDRIAVVVTTPGLSIGCTIEVITSGVA